MPYILEGQVFDFGWWRERDKLHPPTDPFNLQDHAPHNPEDDPVRERRGPGRPPKSDKIGVRADPKRENRLGKCPECGIRTVKGRCYRCEPENCPNCGRVKHKINGRCYQCHPVNNRRMPRQEEKDRGDCPACGKPLNRRNGRCYACSAKGNQYTNVEGLTHAGS